jgi:putative hydroxymethylpyrimidine transport system ATP-binding protein
MVPQQPEPKAFDVHLRDIGLAYRGETLFEALDLTLPVGEWTCLLGPSGVGKSSLLRIVAGLAEAGYGRVTASDGQPLSGRIAFMAQQDALLPWQSALGNVTIGARLRGEPVDRAGGLAALRAVGLDDRASARPAELSGGERQRVALARTLVERRPLVLMDEPFSALDVLTRARLQDLAAERLRGRTVLLITHDPLEALRLGHRVYWLSGRPARLSEPLMPAGPPPRAVDDPTVLARQGELMALLTDRPAREVAA